MSILSTYPPMRGLANVPWYFGLFGSGPSTSSVTTTGGGVGVTASSTANTKGAWVQLVASTATECGLMIVNPREIHALNTETSILLDLATGAAGSESAFVQNIAVGGVLAGGNAAEPRLPIYLPIRIPAGSRVAARAQASTGSKSMSLSWAFYNFAGTNALVPTSLDVLGTSTVNSRGTAMSGASGSYVEITASTSQPYRAVVIVPSVPTNNVTTARVVRYTAAFGAAGAESDLGSILADYSTAEWVRTFGSAPILPIGCNVPAGSRIAVKHDISANPEDHACCVIGVP